jgi:hypothetical protein
MWKVFGRYVSYQMALDECHRLHTFASKLSNHKLVYVLLAIPRIGVGVL